MSSPVAIVPAISTSSGISPAGLFERHSSDVARWVVRLGGPSIEVEDVVQEVFAVVVRKVDQFRGDAKPETWLFRITEKIVRNHRRRLAVRRILSLWANPDDADQTASEDPGPFEHLEKRQRALRAYALLDRLPEKQRQVLILYELEALSTDDIARLMDVKPATVRVWLFRARERFVNEKSSRRGRQEEQ